MAYPTAAGVRQLGAAGVLMIPEIFSAKILPKYYRKSVFGAITMREHEGEIKNQGDTVHIRGTPTITVRNHQRGQALTYERPTPASVDLLIDKGKYWAFQTDDPDDAQVDIKNYVNKWAEAAAKDLEVAVDADVLSGLPADAHASNIGNSAGLISANIALGADGGTSVALTVADIVTKILECEQVLDEQNAPDDPGDRFFVAPTWAKTLLLLSDLKNAFLTGDSVSPVRNGKIGPVGKFTVYSSNNLSTSADGSSNTCTKMLFGSKQSINFAAQLVKTQMDIIDPNSFGRLYRGLMAYGYEVTKPEGLGVLYARKG